MLTHAHSYVLGNLDVRPLPRPEILSSWPEGTVLLVGLYSCCVRMSFSWSVLMSSLLVHQGTPMSGVKTIPILVCCFVGIGWCLFLQKWRSSLAGEVHLSYMTSLKRYYMKILNPSMCIWQLSLKAHLSPTRFWEILVDWLLMREKKNYHWTGELAWWLGVLVLNHEGRVQIPAST